MKFIQTLLGFALAITSLSALPQAACNGKFPNLIADICYDCMFPIGLAGGLLNLGVSADDYETGASHLPVCICASNLTAGTPMSLWEPRYMIDTTNKPGCMPLLGGVDISPPYNASEYGGEKSINKQVGGRAKAAR